MDWGTCVNDAHLNQDFYGSAVNFDFLFMCQPALSSKLPQKSDIIYKRSQKEGFLWAKECFTCTHKVLKKKNWTS